MLQKPEFPSCAPPLLLHRNKGEAECRQADAGNRSASQSLSSQPWKIGRKAMYIGIGGLILLIVLLVVLL
jgi:hypothetical protein